MCSPSGRMAIVPPQSWMFLRSYSWLRAAPAESGGEVGSRGYSSGLLRTLRVEALAQLDDTRSRYRCSRRHSVGGVQQRCSKRGTKMWSCRMIQARPADEQAQILAQTAVIGLASGRVFLSPQLALLSSLTRPWSTGYQRGLYRFLLAAAPAIDSRYWGRPDREPSPHSIPLGVSSVRIRSVETPRERWRVQEVGGTRVQLR